MSEKLYEIEHVIDACIFENGRCSLYTHYNESDPLSAVGQIALESDEYSGQYLGANCQLNAMYPSHGSLWVVDDHGDVFTTADVSFSEPPFKMLDYRSNGFDWKVTKVFWGQLNGVWCSNDDDVWVTSFAGPAFHWDGKTWQEFELPKAPNAIDGSASDDVYVVGYHGNIHHWDGAQWTKVALPDDISDDEGFTDVCIINRDLVYITGRNSLLLEGNARDGFKNIGIEGYSWYGVANIGERLFLAGGQKGIFEYIDGQFICLKDKGQPVGAFSSKKSVFFIPAEQQPKAWYVEYKPDRNPQWGRYTAS